MQSMSFKLAPWPPNLLLGRGILELRHSGVQGLLLDLSSGIIPGSAGIAVELAKKQDKHISPGPLYSTGQITLM